MSDPGRWHEVERLFELAHDVPEEGRRAWLEERCGSDPELLEEVWDLLTQDLPSGFGESPLSRGGDPVEGRVVGEFRLIRALGSGGMGTVYLAEQTSVQRLVAVKVLPPFAGNAAARARFRREAQVVGNLEHEHVVPLLTAGESEDLAWYAMRYVHGWDLNEELSKQRLARFGRGRPELKLPPFDSPDYTATVVERLASLAEAVQHAHSRGVVHRDVKPQNVLLDEHGVFHLTDFGLAKDESQGTLAASGALLGTPHYMSPEQARAIQGKVDHRTDVYSLGVVLYECLTLKRPFEGRTSQEVLLNIARKEAPALRVANPTVPRDLAVIVEKAMGKQPAWRYDSAQALADDLRRFLRGEPILARPPSLGERTARWFQRHRPKVAVAGLLLAALVAGDSWSSLRQVRAGYRADADLIGAALDQGDWSGDGLELARRAKERADALELESGILPFGLRARLLELDVRMRLDLDSRLAAIRSAYSEGWGRPEPTLDGFAREPDSTLLQRGLHLAQEALVLHSDVYEVQELAREAATWPELEVELATETLVDIRGRATEVTLYRVDAYYGRWEMFLDLGSLPMDPVAVPPGYYLIRVEVEGFGSAELVRRLQPRAEPFREVALVRSDEDVLQGMVELPDGEVRFASGRSLGCLVGGPSTPVAGFHVDEACVSNAEFVAFLQATGRVAPERWRELGYPDGAVWTELLAPHYERWPGLPAVGMTWYEAVAYAEWAGKRLPTHQECERYQRGVGGWRTPAEVPDSPYGSEAVVGQPHEGEKPTDREWYAAYLENTRPVREPAYRQAPEGLFHTFGNVWEYTISGVVETQRDTLVVLPFKVLILGADWAAVEQTLDTHFHWGVDERYDRFDVGIRCVKTPAP